MKVDYMPNTRTLNLSSETASDLFAIGRLSVKLQGHVYSLAEMLARRLARLASPTPETNDAD